MLMIILFRWVPFMLFLQGLMFYTPHILYKWAEDKKVRQNIIKLIIKVTYGHVFKGGCKKVGF